MGFDPRIPAEVLPALREHLAAVTLRDLGYLQKIAAPKAEEEKEDDQIARLRACWLFAEKIAHDLADWLSSEKPVLPPGQD